LWPEQGARYATSLAKGATCLDKVIRRLLGQLHLQQQWPAASAFSPQLHRRCTRPRSMGKWLAPCNRIGRTSAHARRCRTARCTG